jgi:hypothetical protein
MGGMDRLNAREINPNHIRAEIWLFAFGAILFAVVAGLGFSLISPAESENSAVAIKIIDPNAPQGKPADDVINPTIEPIQVMFATQRDEIVLEEGGITWRMKPRATFIIGARIVGNKSYHDWLSDVAPLDLLVSWGELSNPEVDQWIYWDQFSRLGSFQWSSSIPYTGDYINNHAANIHVIPATENLMKAISELDHNENALMAGLLVDVRSNQGSIDTSLTRTDTGLGACEIYYVERLVIDGMEYR